MPQGASLDTGTDGVVDRLRTASFGIYLLFILGIDEGVFAILADEDFVRHMRYFIFCGVRLPQLGTLFGVSMEIPRFPMTIDYL